ncbi:hypothetical protein SHKM778_57520 [Streptomyces sp. KM77-8]|uniref:Uncharacterized protein n=1 Tax=Streptomyces haneummycinicus TaxID=3074435 RepID=A0AAT9HPA8_9ACTN
MAGAALGVDGEVADLQGESRTAGVQAAVEHQRAAHTTVAGGHAQQVAGAASGAVPVFGEGGEVDVVGREGGPSIPAARTCSAKISRTGAPAGQARCRG